MKIAPKRDILIRGIHSPAGEPVEVGDRLAAELIAIGEAVRWVEPAASAPADDTVNRAPDAEVIETAEAPAATETAASNRTPARKRRA